MKKHIGFFIFILVCIMSIGLLFVPFSFGGSQGGSSQNADLEKSDNFNLTILKLRNPVVLYENSKYDGYSYQSLEIYNNKIYSFFSDSSSNGFIEIRDYDTFNVISTMEFDGGHFNGTYLSNIWHDTSDDTPLFFTGRCTWETLVTSFYFKENVAYSYKTYSFDSTYAGNQASFVLDSNNNVGYTIGTRGSGMKSDSLTVIGVWDLTKEIQLDNGNYTFELIDSFDIEPLPFKQDVTFYNGKIWLLTCRLTNNYIKAIYGISPIDKRIEFEINDFIVNQVRFSEGEGFVFYNNYLFVNTQRGNLVRYNFS